MTAVSRQTHLIHHPARRAVQGPDPLALLKGEIWPDNAGHGLVHRSPQPGPGGKRLLLTLDIV